MSASVPAPLWRRLAAAFYDAFLLVAVWMVGLWIEVLVRDALDLGRNLAVLRGYAFLLGLAFFGYFWTHGGQTLGMRAWRLRVQRADGAAVDWRRAAVRYAIAWVAWGALGLGLLWCLVDRRGRAWQDLASGTEVRLEPKAEPR